ncbi:MAG: signal peptidase I [Spirulina sp. SIO3F2]|nr:signal peptidase I [Spirulina sp. SIO3F2]
MAAPDLEPTPPSLTWQQTLWENGKTVVFSLVIVFIIRMFIAEPRYIPSASMLPTLEEGDRVVVEKVSYYFQPPHQGDVIVFNPPAQLQDWGYLPNQAFIKRVIGTPGHAIAVQNHQVYEDEQALQEPYIFEPPAYEMPSLPIPRETLFVMGDNRNNSNDSHVWGYLPAQNVIGRAVFRFWPLNRMGWI